MVTSFGIEAYLIDFSARYLFPLLFSGGGVFFLSSFIPKTKKRKAHFLFCYSSYKNKARVWKVNFKRIMAKEFL